MAIDTLTEVVTQAGTHDLVDQDAVKDELKLTATNVEHDAYLARTIAQVSAAVADYCNRVFAAEEIRDRIYSGLGLQQLRLSRFPVIDVTTATIADGAGGQTALVANTDFIVDKRLGYLVRLGAGGTPTRWFTSPTTVTYRAGLEDIPEPVQQATLRMVIARFHGRGRDPTLRSQSTPGLGDQTYWIGSVPGAEGPFPDDIVVLLDAYRVPVGP